jgi:hypothetical protein
MIITNWSNCSRSYESSKYIHSLPDFKLILINA